MKASAPGVQQLSMKNMGASLKYSFEAEMKYFQNKSFLDGYAHITNHLNSAYRT